MIDAIRTFISHSRSKGLDHATIRHLLMAAGWKEKEIAHAIAAEGLDIAVPEPSGGNTRDSFIFLMSFASLYVVIGSVIGLYYTFLDYLYPDAAWENSDVDGALSGARYALAAIFVAFPLFLVLSRVLARIVQRTPDSRQQHVVRWLTYLTMFIAAAVAAGDLITLLYYFLDGSLTTRFVLKVIVLFVIAEIILSYYYLAPLSAARNKQGVVLRRILEAAGTLVVTGALALGFVLAGSPFTARQHRLDERRVADLRGIHIAIQEMTTRREHDVLVITRALPTTLDEVAEFQRSRQFANALSLADPQTDEQYEYMVRGEATYELCARFVLPRDRNRDLFWNHPAGKHCFSFKVDAPP